MGTQTVPRAGGARLIGTPPALGRPLAILLGTAAVVIAGAGLRAAAEIVAPIMLGLVLTIAVLPLWTWARRHGWPGWCGTLLALVSACAIVLVLVLGLSLAVVKLVELVPQYAEGSTRLQANGADFLTSHGIGAGSAGTAADAADPAKL